MGKLVDDMLEASPGWTSSPIPEHEVGRPQRAGHRLCRVGPGSPAPGRPGGTEIAPGLATTGDQELLRRAVDNLLANVRVHTPEGTVAKISAARSNSWARDRRQRRRARRARPTSSPASSTGSTAPARPRPRPGSGLGPGHRRRDRRRPPRHRHGRPQPPPRPRRHRSPSPPSAQPGPATGVHHDAHRDALAPWSSKTGPRPRSHRELAGPAPAYQSERPPGQSRHLWAARR